MNEFVAALPLVGSVMWTCRPRPPVRRLTPGEPTVSTTSTTRRRPWPRRRSPTPDPIALAHWCEGIARCVRGGDALRTAVDRPPDDASITAIVEAIRRHVADPHRTRLTPDAALVAAVVSACLDQGGPSAEPLDRAAGVLRARAAERDERRVQSAQARLSAIVLTWLPVVVLVVLVVTSDGVRRVVTTPVGIMLVTAGSLLNLAGWWWMRRIVERASR